MRVAAGPFGTQLRRREDPGGARAIQTHELIKEETAAYRKKLLGNERDMKIKKYDLAVFRFMMTLTKCQKTALLQLDDTHGQAQETVICESPQGLLELNFDDAKTQAALERRMTPSACRAIHEPLGCIQAVQVAERYQPFNASNGTFMNTVPAQKVEVKTYVGKAGPFKCNRGHQTAGSSTTTGPPCGASLRTSLASSNRRWTRTSWSSRNWSRT